ncbi:hypothetical protein [Halomicronema hongdechloris]|uniref:hypothetical protein n=1 Tax=Halomicronema hongdechloris TaxID=1209493 RepID=UPI001650D681|nr:hypothetical protein [Halomicronema hongdechloris]
MKQENNRQNRLGIFLYYESPANERICAFLSHWEPVPYWGKIQGVKATHQIASRLIPKEMQEGAESWLILYRANVPGELLVLPFPDEETPSSLNDPQKFGNYLSGLLEYIYGGNRNWYPYNGFRNLIEYIQRGRTYSFPHPIPPRKFQVVRFDSPLEELLKQPEIRFYD